MIPIISSPLFIEHLTGTYHPESPGRWQAISEVLSKAGLMLPGNTFSPRKATKKDLMLCHTEEYIQLVEQECKMCSDISMLSTGDAQICPKSYEIAVLAAGAALVAVDKVLDEDFKRAVSIARPPGHHAESNKGMGFCLFNNVAIAARYAQKKYGVKKILIVDWDVHHGNGTQEIFYEDPSVFYFSTHQWPFYPGTGSDHEVGVGTNLNVPIVGGEGSRERVIEAFQGPLVDTMKSFQPNFVLISAGFDAHKLDPIGGMDLTEEDFGRLTEIVLEIGKGRAVSVLEGGYHLGALAQSVKVHVEKLSAAK